MTPWYSPNLALKRSRYNHDVRSQGEIMKWNVRSCHKECIYAKCKIAYLNSSGYIAKVTFRKEVNQTLRSRLHKCLNYSTEIKTLSQGMHTPLARFKLMFRLMFWNLSKSQGQGHKVKHHSIKWNFLHEGIYIQNIKTFLK